MQYDAVQEYLGNVSVVDAAKEVIKRINEETKYRDITDNDISRMNAAMSLLTKTIREVSGVKNIVDDVQFEEAMATILLLQKRKGARTVGDSETLLVESKRADIRERCRKKCTDMQDRNYSRGYKQKRYVEFYEERDKALALLDNDQEDRRKPYGGEEIAKKSLLSALVFIDRTQR